MVLMQRQGVTVYVLLIKVLPYLLVVRLQVQCVFAKLMIT